MGLYSGYRPGESINLAQEGQSLQRQNAMIAEGSVLANSLLNEAKVAAAESQGQQAVDQVPGIGQQAFGGLMRGLGPEIPGIIDGFKSPGTSFGSMPGTPVSDSYMNKLTNFYGA